MDFVEAFLKVDADISEFKSLKNIKDNRGLLPHLREFLDEFNLNLINFLEAELKLIYYGLDESDSVETFHLKIIEKGKPALTSVFERNFKDEKEFFIFRETGFSLHERVEFNGAIAIFYNAFFNYLIANNLREEGEINFSYSVEPYTDSVENILQSVRDGFCGYNVFRDNRSVQDILQIHNHFGYHDKIESLFFSKTSEFQFELIGICNFFKELESSLETYQPTDKHIQCSFGYSRSLYHKLNDEKTWFMVNFQKGNWFNVEIRFDSDGRIIWRELHADSLVGGKKLSGYSGVLSYADFMTFKDTKDSLDVILESLALYEITRQNT